MKALVIILFTLLLGCKNSTNELPILSYKIDNSGTKSFYGINYTGFTNQLGKEFNSQSIHNKVFIANFFFTRCPSICPPMRSQLINLAEVFAHEDNFVIISHTIDPEYDTISVLKNYAEATSIHHSKWQFIRASIENTKQQAEQYMTNFEPNDTNTDFYHSSYVALVDQNKFIRGFYNILIPEEVERLKHDLNIIL